MPNIYEVRYPAGQDEKESIEFYDNKALAKKMWQLSDGLAELNTHYYNPTREGVVKLLNWLREA